MTPQRRKELFLVGCAAAMVFVVLGALNLGGIQPFRDRHVGLGVLFFVLAVLVLAGINFVRPEQARS
jgi:hypothetical protein